MIEIKGTNGMYKVSPDGRIFSVRANRFVNPFLSTKGYHRIRLYISGDRKPKFLYVHRAVAEAYISNKNGLPQINHINGIKTDNRVDNLEWCTASQNVKHSWGMGRNRKKGVLVLDTLTGVFYDRISDAAKAGGYLSSTLANMLRGHRSNRSKYVYA